MKHLRGLYAQTFFTLRTQTFFTLRTTYVYNNHNNMHGTTVKILFSFFIFLKTLIVFFLIFINLLAPEFYI